MAERRFKVRVFTKSVTPGEPGREDLSKAFNIAASHPDKAALFARVRLEELGHEVLAISHAPNGGIVATIGRDSRVGPPTVLTAKVAVASPRRRRVGGR